MNAPKCTCYFLVTGRYAEARWVLKDDLPMYGALVCPREPRRNKRCSRGDLFEVYWQVNIFKVIVHLMRCAHSYHRYEQKWLSYILQSWSENEVDWSANNLVYTGVVPGTRDEYHGEARIGIRRRVQTHDRDSFRRARRMRLYKYMRAHGPQCLTWMPVRTWNSNQRPPTKSERLVEESFEICWRQSSLNDVGKSFGEEKADVFFERLMVGRRKRGRQLMKFRIGIRKEVWTTNLESDTNIISNSSDFLPCEIMGKRVNVDRKPPRAQRNSVRPTSGEYLKWLPVVVRLARRPWAVTPEFRNLRIVKRLRELNHRQLTRVLGLAHMALDVQGRSIFWVNLRNCMKGRENIAVLNVKIKSAALAQSAIEKLVLKGLRRWMGNWNKAGVLIMLRATIVQAGAQSLISMLDTSSSWGKKPRELLR